jgi:glycosyltransferase involved in cell wall biosynthesis
LRVLYLSNGWNRTSTLVPTEGWFRFLRPHGLDPVFVSPRIGPFHLWAREQGIATHELSLPFPNKRFPFPFLRTLWRLRRLVNRHGTQLIHCNEQDVYPVGQYLARLCKLPVVVSVHFAMQRGFCDWAFPASRQPRRMFFVSRGCQELCRPALDGILPEAAWRVLPNGLDLDHFRPDPLLRESFRQQHGLRSQLTVGVACALRPRKQLEQLFDAVSRLRLPDVRVLLAGGIMPGDETYANNLLREARAKLGDKLVHVGRLTELRGFYNALDVFVNTSKEEACSISVLEALACGCPVIGYPSKTVDEQVLPAGGEIVEQDRVDMLSDCLGRWLTDPALLPRARLGARQRAEDGYNIRKISLSLLAEYQQVLNKSTGQSDGVDLREQQAIVV